MTFSDEMIETLKLAAAKKAERLVTFFGGQSLFPKQQTLEQILFEFVMENIEQDLYDDYLVNALELFADENFLSKVSSWKEFCDWKDALIYFALSVKSEVLRSLEAK
jgi:hypothetical protein